AGLALLLLDRIGAVLHVFPVDRKRVEVHRAGKQFQDVLADDYIALNRLERWRFLFRLFCDPCDHIVALHAITKLASLSSLSPLLSSSRPASSTISSSFNPQLRLSLFWRA